MDDGCASSSVDEKVPEGCNPYFQRSKQEKPKDHRPFITERQFIQATKPTIETMEEEENEENTMEEEKENDGEWEEEKPPLVPVVLEPLERYLDGTSGDNLYFRQYHLRLISYLGLYEDTCMPRFTSDTSEWLDQYGNEWYPWTHWFDFDIIDRENNEYPLRLEFSSTHYIGEFYGRNLFGNLYHRITGETVAALNVDEQGKWIEGEFNGEIGNEDCDSVLFPLEISVNKQSITVQQYVPHTSDTAQYHTLKTDSYNEGKTAYTHEYKYNHDIEKAVSLIMNLRVIFQRNSPLFIVNHPMSTRIHYKYQFLKHILSNDTHPFSGIDGLMHILAEYVPADLPLTIPDLANITPQESTSERENADLGDEEDDDYDDEQGE